MRHADQSRHCTLVWCWAVLTAVTVLAPPDGHWLIGPEAAAYAETQQKAGDSQVVAEGPTAHAEKPQPSGKPEEETIHLTSFKRIDMLVGTERVWRLKEPIERVEARDPKTGEDARGIVEVVRLSPSRLKASAKSNGYVHVKLTTSADEERSLAVAVHDALGDADRRTFIISPLTTDLQRLGSQTDSPWGYDRTTAKVRVLVNGAALARKDGTLDPLAFRSCVWRLGMVLGSWANRDQGSVCFEVRWQGLPSELPDLYGYDSILALGFEGVAQRAGFGRSYARVTFNPGEPWESVVADLTKSPEKDLKADESPVGNELVNVYPVRTAVSRSEWGADCVIHVLPPVHTLTAELIGRIPQVMREYVDQLEMERKDRVVFLFSSIATATVTEVQRERVRTLGSPEIYRDLLGFKSVANKWYILEDAAP